MNSPLPAQGPSVPGAATADRADSPSPAFSVGDRVTCVKDNSNAAGCKSVLRRGETYTVSAVVDQPWGVGIDLLEKPSQGRALYGPRRFVRAEDAQ